jgi:PAS domain S-box-containing protein
MSTLQGGRFQYVCGEVVRCYEEQGCLRLTIGSRQISVIGFDSARRIHSGQFVRLLLRRVNVRSGCGAYPVFKVLVWQRHGERRAHYNGARAGLGLILGGIGLLIAGGALRNGLLIACGVGLLMVQLLLLGKRAWTLRAFNRRGLHVESMRVVDGETRPPPPDIPLDLPISKPRAVPRLAASSWPAEILEFTHDAIIIWEMGGAGILYWNKAAEQLYGYSRVEAHGRVTHELLKTEIATGGVSELESRLARFGIWIGTLGHTRKDGHPVTVEARLSLMSQQRGSWLVLEVNRDITAWSDAEAKRRALERQLALLRSQTSRP